MNIFVTGATGFIGSAIVRELRGAGHHVTGLARSDASAQALEKAGAAVQRGSLTDLESLKQGASASDGVIHAAFVHDFTDFIGGCETDRVAIEALGEALAGSGRPLVVTAGTLGRAQGRAASEDDSADPKAEGPRRSEPTAIAMAERGVRASVVRLPPSVHGDGDGGFVPMLIDIARDKGMSAYVGDGRNRWPAVHRLDAARLFRLALEKGVAGARFHGVDDEGVLTRDIAEVIGRRLSLPVISKSPEEAPAHFGWLGGFFGMDRPSTSALTRERLGWKPTHPGLLADLDRPSYFEP